MYNKLIKFKKANFSSLIDFGFIRDGNLYKYKTVIKNGEFELLVTIDENSNIDTSLLELEINEDYTLYKTDSQGSFVQEVRNEVQKVLQKIIEICYFDDRLSNEQTRKIANYIKEKYQVTPEYLWKEYPSFAVFRRKDSQKWFAVIMNITKDKLGLSSKESVDVINLKVDNLEQLINNETVFRGWHMNKKYWCTIILNESYPTEKLFEGIDKSYLLNK